MENERYELQSIQSLSSNLLAESMGFNMSLELSPGDDPDDDYAKITKVWEKSARADPNHIQHYIEIHSHQANLS